LSVTSVTAIEATGDITEEGAREYVVTLEVITNSVNDGPYTVLTTASLPTRGQQYSYGGESDPYAFCRRVGGCKLRDVDGTRKIWRLSAHYSTLGSKENPENQPGNPLDWAWKISGRVTGDRKPKFKDRNNRAIANSADEPFDPAPELLSPNVLLDLKKNTATISLEQWWNSQGAVNNADIWGLGSSRKARINTWTWDIIYTGNGGAYIANHFEVEVRRDKFLFEPLDQGFRKKIGINGNGEPEYAPILIRGDIPSKEIPLDGQGSVLLAGAPLVFFDGAGDNPEPFELEDEIDFSSIFPNPLPGPFV
jgi:hypothetical protein